MPRSVERAFLLFHGTLGMVVLVDSVRTALYARSFGTRALFVLALFEAAGAALFLARRTLLVGSGMMLAAFAVAFVVHAAKREFHLSLLVYAAGTILVAARHRTRTSPPA